MHVSACFDSLEDVRFCGYPQKRTWGNLHLAEISTYFILESEACELRSGIPKYIHSVLVVKGCTFLRVLIV